MCTVRCLNILSEYLVIHIFDVKKCRFFPKMLVGGYMGVSSISCRHFIKILQVFYSFHTQQAMYRHVSYYQKE